MSRLTIGIVFMALVATINAQTPAPTPPPTFDCGLCQNDGICDPTNTYCLCRYPHFGEFCENTQDCACTQV